MATNHPLLAAACCALTGALLFALGGCSSDGDPDRTVFGDLLDPLIMPTPTEAAVDMLDPDNADNRRRGVSLIAASPFGGEEVYVKVYRELLYDSDPTVRAASARAIGDHGGPADALLLAPLIDNRVEETTELNQRTTVIRYNEGDPLVRWEAAHALQKLHNPRVVDPLISAVLRDSDADVRAAAAAALGQYATPTVYDPLLSALTDPQYRVVRAAQQSLTTLTGYDLGNDPDKWLAYRRLNGDALFADRQTYTYDPWAKPPGFFQKLRPWSKSRQEKTQPQIPAGM